jgi:poly-gamma-glutamate synthase PgsB/CapB
MSIHRENHIVESRQILKPNIVVVTNTWPDHVDAHGETEEEVAATLCLDIPDKANVFVSPSCNSTAFEASTDVAHGKLFVIEEDNATSVRQRVQELETAEFTENIALVHGVARHLGIEDEMIADGLATMSRDLGALALREMRVGDPKKRLLLVNAFAANDPTSTYRVLKKTKEVLPETAPLVGLLCLRSDRADRTAQWLESLGGGTSDPFSTVFVAGGHSSFVARQLASARKLKIDSPENVMSSIASEVDDGTVVFGFGNFVGLGSRLAEYWNTEGVAYGP